MDELNSKLIFRGRLSVFEALNGTLPHTGTLYIGRASRLQSRLQQLVRSVRRSRSSEHPACKRLRYPPLSKRFHSDSLALTWCYEPECQMAEHAQLRAYQDSFGETPPLNGNVG